jgi:hypothetical protein
VRCSLLSSLGCVSWIDEDVIRARTWGRWEEEGRYEEQEKKEGLKGGKEGEYALIEPTTKEV